MIYRDRADRTEPRRWWRYHYDTIPDFLTEGFLRSNPDWLCILRDLEINEDVVSSLDFRGKAEVIGRFGSYLALAREQWLESPNRRLFVSRSNPPP